MTVNPATVDAGDSLDIVEALLRELDVRHMPVVEDGVLGFARRRLADARSDRHRQLHGYPARRPRRRVTGQIATI